MRPCPPAGVKGGGWCSWGCFYGGLDEGFSKIGRRPILKNIRRRWTYLPFAVLLVVALASAVTLTPMGAFQSFTNKVNIFDVRVDPDKCVQCSRCEKACPTFSIDSESIRRGKTRITCTKCGKCIDECPEDAISYHIKGTPPGVRPQAARMLFVYPAFLFLAIMGSGMIQGAVYRVLMLATTGSMIE